MPHFDKVSMFQRTIFLIVFLFTGNAALYAAPECPVSVNLPKPPADVVDWYDKFIAPARALTGAADTARPNRYQIETFIDGIREFHRRALTDILIFEPLVQQIATSHANSGDFLGLNSRAAEKIYRAGSGPSLDFSSMCIDTRREKFPDDTFAITLFGVNTENCQRVTGRGLVFTNTLVNGSPNGECRPDYVTFRLLVIPVVAGTNSITFVCNKDVNGCAGR